MDDVRESEVHLTREQRRAKRKKERMLKQQQIREGKQRERGATATSEGSSSAEARIARMKARLAKIRESEAMSQPEPPRRPPSMQPAQPQQGWDDDEDDLDFTDEDDDGQIAGLDELMEIRGGGGGGGHHQQQHHQQVMIDEQSSEDDVPDIDTRVRSTMAHKRHWKMVEEQRKREEENTRRRILQKQEQRRLEDLRLEEESKRRRREEESLWEKAKESEFQKIQDDWKKKEDEIQRKAELKITEREAEIARLEDAIRQRQELKQRMSAEEERRRMIFEEELARIEEEEQNLRKKVEHEMVERKRLAEEEEKRRAEELERKRVADEIAIKKAREEELRRLEEEEKELLRREAMIEAELEEKRRKREIKLKELRKVLNAEESQALDEKEGIIHEEPPSKTEDRMFDQILEEMVIDEPKITYESGDPLTTNIINSFVVSVPKKRVKLRKAIYENCFSGIEAVATVNDKLSITSTSRDAVSLLNLMLQSKVIWSLDGSKPFEEGLKNYALDDENAAVKNALKKGGAAATSTAGSASGSKQSAAEVIISGSVDDDRVSFGSLQVVDDAGQALPEYDFDVWQGINTVGRRGDNDIVLPVLSVSKVHAKIECTAKDRFAITDLGSSNLTKVFKSADVAEPITLSANKPLPLVHGAEILFGEIRCVFEMTKLDTESEPETEFDINSRATVVAPKKKKEPTPEPAAVEDSKKGAAAVSSSDEPATRGRFNTAMTMPKPPAKQRPKRSMTSTTTRPQLGKPPSRPLSKRVSKPPSRPLSSGKRASKPPMKLGKAPVPKKLPPTKKRAPTLPKGGPPKKSVGWAKKKSPAAVEDDDEEVYDDDEIDDDYFEPEPVIVMKKPGAPRSVGRRGGAALKSAAVADEYDYHYEEEEEEEEEAADQLGNTIDDWSAAAPEEEYEYEYVEEEYGDEYLGDGYEYEYEEEEAAAFGSSPSSKRSYRPPLPKSSAPRSLPGAGSLRGGRGGPPRSPPPRMGSSPSLISLSEAKRRAASASSTIGRGPAPRAPLLMNAGLGPLPSTPIGEGVMVDNYVAKKPSQLTLMAGTSLTIWDEPHSGWYRVEANGDVGLVPGSFIERQRGGTSRAPAARGFKYV